MYLRSCLLMVATAVCLIASSQSVLVADEPAKAEPATVESPARKAAERGLAFLLQDAVKWRETKKCATCHHGTMTVWAMSEAKRQGYTVAPETFADTLQWTQERLKDLDKPRDTRPGWKMVNTPALYLATLATTVPGQDAIPPAEQERIKGHLLRHQEADGEWAWSSAPPQNRYPPVFESDEVATLLGLIAIGPTTANDSAELTTARDRAQAWLAKAEATHTTQAKTFHLLLKVRSKSAAEDLKANIDHLLSLQNQDGGWSQLKDRASDAYATGQVLYVLNVAGLPSDRAEVQRGVSFLVTTQREDGSWPMTPRSHPGAKPASNIVPITYFGSAWGTLGLMRATSE